jgi:predicted nucleotidyltransferase
MNFEKTVKLLKEKLNCEVIILFGSYARGDQRPDSDVDIAIKTKKEISKKEIFELTQELEQLLKKDVDLVDLNAISDSFRYEILMNGQILYCEDNYQFDLYKLDMFREYLELNESRKDIIQNIKNGGTIYGK